jgi:hypothetical protein
MDFNNLRRRRDRDRPDMCHIFCGDVCAGYIALATGRPNAATEWTWSVGFYPGSRAGEIKTGTAPTFESARAAFETHWLLSWV